MKQLSHDEVKTLVNSGLAGWYAVNANPPIPHKACYVVSLLDGRHFLVGPEVLSVEPGAVTSVNGVPKQVFAVKIDSDSEVGHLLMLDMTQKQKENVEESTFVAMCESLPLDKTIYTGTRSGP